MKIPERIDEHPLTYKTGSTTPPLLSCVVLSYFGQLEISCSSKETMRKN